MSKYYIYFSEVNTSFSGIQRACTSNRIVPILGKECFFMVDPFIKELCKETSLYEFPSYVGNHYLVSSSQLGNLIKKLSNHYRSFFGETSIKNSPSKRHLSQLEKMIDKLERFKNSLDNSKLCICRIY